MLRTLHPTNLLCARPLLHGGRSSEKASIQIDAVLKDAPREKPLRVLDLGTGSGAILAAILSQSRRNSCEGGQVGREFHRLCGRVYFLISLRAANPANKASASE